MTPATTAVVGAQGFIGSALTAALAARSVPTLTFTRASPPLALDGTLAPGLAHAATIVWAAASINPAIAESRPDKVDADRDSLGRLLTALGQQESSPARFVFLSSGGTVYDPAAPVPYREDSRCAPQGAYGRAKVESESLVLAAADPVVLRIANAYGPGQPVAPGQGVISHWLHTIHRGDPVTVFGSPETARDYIHIDDIVSAVVAVVAAPQTPRVLNIGSGYPTTLEELRSAVESVTGPFAVQHRESRSFDVSRTWLDVSLAQQALGWRAGVTLADGIASTWRSVHHGRPT